MSKSNTSTTRPNGRKLVVGGRVVLKTTKLLDGEGRKVERKVRRDEKGLYIIRHGMKGRISSTTTGREVGDKYLDITTVRRVTHYDAVAK